MSDDNVQVVSVGLFVTLRSPFDSDILTEDEALDLVRKYFRLHNDSSINGFTFEFELDRIENCNP